MSAKNSITIRAKRKKAFTEVRLMIEHPMAINECSYEMDESKQKTLFIQELRCIHNKKLVIHVQMGYAIAANPYFAFRFKGGEQGDKIRISWVDNQGNRDDKNAKIY